MKFLSVYILIIVIIFYIRFPFCHELDWLGNHIFHVSLIFDFYG